MDRLLELHSQNTATAAEEFRRRSGPRTQFCARRVAAAVRMKREGSRMVTGHISDGCREFRHVGISRLRPLRCGRVGGPEEARRAAQGVSVAAEVQAVRIL